MNGSRVARVLAIPAALALLVVGAPLQFPASSTKAAPAQATSRCSNIQLAVTPLSGQGAAGTIYEAFRIHELWGSACSLYGYPGLELLDRQFHSLPTHVQRGGLTSPPGTGPAKLVILDRQHDAFFSLAYSDVPIGNGPCPKAPYLMVTPPNDFLPDVTYSAKHGAMAPCSGRVRVSAVSSKRSF